jgi:hypothetical protein
MCVGGTANDAVDTSICILRCGDGSALILGSCLLVLVSKGSREGEIVAVGNTGLKYPRPHTPVYLVRVQSRDF